MLQSVRGLPVAVGLLATVLVCVSAHATIFSASGTIAYIQAEFDNFLAIVAVPHGGRRIRWAGAPDDRAAPTPTAIYRTRV